LLQIELDTVAAAQELQTQLETILEARKADISSSFTDELAILNRAKASLPSLVAAIETSNDPNKLEEMLLLNDSITELIKQVESSKPPRPSLVLNGLRNGSYAHSDVSSSTPGTPSFSAGVLSPILNRSFSNSSLSSLTSAQLATGQQGSDDDDAPTTPRVDKGKGKAVHHEEPGSFLVAGEEGKIIPEPGAAVDENIGSPTDSRYVGFCFIAKKHVTQVYLSFFCRSRTWVEEEGEVFRKGVALLTPEKMEGELSDFAGDDLRIELLEAEVQRPPARILDVDADGEPIPENQPPMSPPIPRMVSVVKGP
jgi:protein phosphatase 1 regulatory subunit 37